MTRHLWRGDLAWAGFIVMVAVAFGLTQHWDLVRISFRGELNGHLEQQRARYRQTRFQGVKTLNLAQALELFQQGRALFADARKPEEYEELHIPGALNLPPENLAKDGAPLLAGIDKDRQIVVYCGQANCHDSLKVAEKLQALGYTQVMAFLGGFKTWDEAGYPADTKK